MTELICIVCPKGCHLKVDEEKDFAVTGNGCPRGAEYGKKELTNPTRVITSTVCVEGGAIRRARRRGLARVGGTLRRAARQPGNGRTRERGAAQTQERSTRKALLLLFLHE